MAVDWLAIKTEYITTDISYRKLAEKHGVNYSVIGARARAEGWVEQRTQFRDKTHTKTVEKLAEKASNQASKKIASINELADQLIEKLQLAIGELDVHLVTNKRKEKTIEYDNPQRPDKPTKEVIQEEEEILQVKSFVDRRGLRDLTAALKDLKEVKGIMSELDRQEQQARIDKLRRDAVNGDDDDDDTGVIFLPARKDVAEDGG